MNIFLIICSYLISFIFANKQTTNKVFNSSEISTLWDTSNIPDPIVENGKIDEILKNMATKQYRSCKASVLFDPLKELYYFKNPTIKRSNSNSLKDYMALKCKSFKSRTVSDRQRFYLTFKDLEQILDNNEDSILAEGIHEITDLKKGIEMALFPVKFFKVLPENNYSNQKDLLCFDSIKVLGIDKNNNDYFILSAGDKHRILYCDGFDITKTHNINNFIRYSSYCDEFCADDYIYFSDDLIKCKCDFYSYVEDLKKNKKYLNNNTDCIYTRRIDRYEIFANPYEIAEKLIKYEEHNKPHYRYYLYLIIIFFTFQILYAFYFTTKNSLFIKFTIIFYIILAVLVYIPQRLTFTSFEMDVLKIFELISDLYPIILMVIVCLDMSTSNNSNKQYEVLKLSYIIFINATDYILKETRINEIELIFRLCLITCTFALSANNFIEFYLINVRIKNIFEFVSRLILYLVEYNKIPDLSVPLFIILGRPKEYYILSDHLLFQINYLKLKPYFEKLYENWFLETLNFHKFKNMILFLKFSRYIFILLILSLINCFTEVTKMVTYTIELRFEKLITSFITITYKNFTNIFFCSNSLVNYIHFPVIISLLYINVILSKDIFKLFLIHFVIGWIVSLLSCDNVSHPHSPSAPPQPRRVHHSSSRSLNNFDVGLNLENFNGINNNIN